MQTDEDLEGADLDFEIDEDELSDETDAEREAREGLDVELDEDAQDFVDRLVEKLMQVCDVLSGHPLRKYQRPFAHRFFESLILNDGATLTALFARQTGKSETVADVVATAMIMLPLLAKAFPEWLGKFSEGVLVGAFAPVDKQADTLYSRIVARLTSEHASAVLNDPEVAGRVIPKGTTHRIKMPGGIESLVRKTTAHPRATIEGDTYHIILIDECFPAGTPVLTSEGWVRIEDIAGNASKDWIVATQGADGQMAWAPVKSSYKTRRANDLIRVVHEHGTMYATANHPFMVGGETVPAALLRPGTPLSVVQGAPEPARGPAEEMPTVNGSSVLQLAPGAASERHGKPGGPGEDGEHAQENRASPYSPWGEWHGTYGPPADPARLTRSGLAPRACSVHWKKTEGRPSDPLQDRSGSSGNDDRSGDRRRVARDLSPAGIRPAQDFVVVESRVVSVEILEPGSPEFDRFSDQADYVYTLEVDHPSHVYVAAGVYVGNCQGADDQVVSKSISPMGASTNATMVYTGTPARTKNVFHKQIQINKREMTQRGRKRQNHFEVDWREAAKENDNYLKFVRKEMVKLGEDSDEFKLSYRLLWLLDKGMFTTSEKLDNCGDITMQKLVEAYHLSPVVVGIDCARKQDRTIVTVIMVDWNNPDELGMYHHRILNWLDLEGLDWEGQYKRIVEFLANYRVWKVGIDVGGLGDVVAQRLRILMPQIEIVDFGSSQGEQTERWLHLRNLIDRRQVVYPAGSKVKRLKVWKRFRQEMEDLEIHFKNAYVLAAAPNARDAHDDYGDSLAIGCFLTKNFQDEEGGQVEVAVNPFYRGHSRSRYEGH